MINKEDENGSGTYLANSVQLSWAVSITTDASFKDLPT